MQPGKYQKTGGEQLTHRLDAKLFQYIGEVLHPDEMEVRTMTLAKSPHISDVKKGARLWRIEMERAYSGRRVWIRREGQQWEQYHCLDFNAPGAMMRITRGPNEPIQVVDPEEMEVESRVERTLRLTVANQSSLGRGLSQVLEQLSQPKTKKELEMLRRKTTRIVVRMTETQEAIERCVDETRRYRQLSKTLARL